MSEKSQPHTMNRTLFKVAIEGYPYLFWQPDCVSDVVIITRGHLKQINDYNQQEMKLQPTDTKFYAANLSRMKFDGYFNATLQSQSGATCNTKVYVANLPITEPPLLNETVLLELGLITYSPEGRVKQISKNQTKQNPSDPKIALNEPEYIKRFTNLHAKYSTVFQGMGLLRDYEVDFKLTEDIEFFHRPSIVPIHLKDRATERLKECIDLGLFKMVPQEHQ